jgi:hypothetical protein
MFSSLQHLSLWTEEKTHRWVESKEHIDFVLEFYDIQHEVGRWFLHEHPEKATSWNLEQAKETATRKGIDVTTLDQCMDGLTTWGKDGKETPARKRTKMMTNCPELIQELDKKCDGSHGHQQLLDGRGKWASRYPENLCRASCK